MRAESRGEPDRHLGASHGPFERAGEVSMAGEAQTVPLGVPDAQLLDRRRVLLGGLRHAVTVVPDTAARTGGGRLSARLTS